MASNPLLKFKVEILYKVVLPKLEGILYSEKGDFSVSELWKEFRKQHDCTVSFREFKEWCDDLNLRPQQTTVWNLPNETPTPSEVPKQLEFVGQGGIESRPTVLMNQGNIDEILSQTEENEFDNE